MEHHHTSLSAFAKQTNVNEDALAAWMKLGMTTLVRIATVGMKLVKLKNNVDKLIDPAQSGGGEVTAGVREYVVDLTFDKSFTVKDGAQVS